MSRYNKNHSGNGYRSVNNIDAEFQAVEDTQADMLSRKAGDTPNDMETDLDMGSNDILNTGSVHTSSLFLDGEEVFALTTAGTAIQNQVNENTDQIQENADNILSNSGQIQSNTDDIQDLQSQVGEGSDLSATVQQNTDDIAQALLDITTVTNSVQTAEANITSNANNITSNESQILSNTNSIATNTGNIAINAGNIALKQDLSEKGALNGYAALDSNGRVPSSQLPLIADEVEEYADLAAFPATGEEGVIYLALDTDLLYLWSGSTYVNPSASDPTVTAHINDNSLHFTEASINHENILNSGINSHTDIDTHISNSSTHFTTSDLLDNPRTVTSDWTFDEDIIISGTSNIRSTASNIYNAAAGQSIYGDPNLQTVIRTSDNVGWTIVEGDTTGATNQVIVALSDGSVRGRIGFESTNNDDLVVRNSKSGGDINLATNGGNVLVDGTPIDIDPDAWFNINSNSGNLNPTTSTATLNVFGGTGLSTSASGSTLTVNLDNTSVAAGSYTNADITVDEQGRVTSVSNGAAAGTSDHTALSNIGTNTHAQIDNHIADSDIHYPQSSISITESQISDLQTYEPAFSKNTAFNDNYGSVSGTVCEGDDSRLSDSRAPLAHNHTLSSIVDFNAGDYATAAQGALASTSLQPGGNISALNNDSSYLTQETMQDNLGNSFLVSGTNVTLDYDDAAGTLTINSTDGSAGSVFTNFTGDAGAGAVTPDTPFDTLFLAGGDGITTTTNPTSDSIAFDLDASVVRTSSDQTIAGNKNFSEGPTVPNDIAYKCRDTGGAITDVLEIDSSDVVTAGNAAKGLNLVGAPVTVNGGTLPAIFSDSTSSTQTFSSTTFATLLDIPSLPAGEYEMTAKMVFEQTSGSSPNARLQFNVTGQDPANNPSEKLILRYYNEGTSSETVTTVDFNTDVLIPNPGAGNQVIIELSAPVDINASGTANIQVRSSSANPFRVRKPSTLKMLSL